MKRARTREAQDADRVRILLVEPDPVDALAIRQLLLTGADSQLDIDDAASLGEGLRALERAPSDVILTSLELPDAQGLDVVERLVAAGVPDGAVIPLTKRYEEGLGEKALRLGAHDYVPKNAMTGAALRRVVRYARARTEGRRALETRLRAERSFADGLIDSMPGMFSLIDANGRVLRRNASLAIALRGDAIETGDAHYLERVWPEDRDLVSRKVTHAFRTGKASLEFRFKRADGTPMPVLINLKRVTHDGEERLISMGIDLTQRRELEAQLVHAQKMESVGRLAGAVAHDFNNMLAAVLSFAELLLMDSAPDDPRRADVQTIHDAATRAAALTRQLLSFSRRQTFTPRPVELNAVVTGLDRMLRRLIGEDIELVTLLGDDVGIVNIDVGQVESALVNLAVNARDAMPSGGTLTIRTTQVAKRAVLTVSDDGCGMPPDILAHVFEPFFTTKEPGKGTGLGLTSVQAIVRQSGGLITVASRVGEGTSFRIELPTVDAASAAANAAPCGDVLRGTETILLAEDNDLVRHAVAATLTARGYTVLSAFNGEELLRHSEQHPGDVHLVISDVIMPRMAAPEMLAKLRKQRPAVRVLLMSGYVSDAIQQEIGGYAFLQKPFTSEAIARKVREVLDAPVESPPPAVV